MKRVGWMVSLVMCWGLYTCEAQAGVGDILHNTWTYLFSPVNCVAVLGHDLIAVGVKFVSCVLGNANRNPATLNPIITIQ